MSLPAAPASKVASSGPFYVNVGLFADANNAQGAQKKVSSAGVPVMSQRVKTPKGELTRVRAGPFASRRQAEQAARKISATGLDAVLVPPP